MSKLSFNRDRRTTSHFTFFSSFQKIKSLPQRKPLSLIPIAFGAERNSEHRKGAVLDAMTMFIRRDFRAESG
jgi:hypothetical protein